MPDKLETLRLAANRLDELRSQSLFSQSMKLKAELVEAERDYAEALDALHRVRASASGC